MVKTINWTFRVEAEGVPPASIPNSLSAEAVTMVEVIVKGKDGESEQDVQLIPVELDKVKFLLITAAPCDEGISYSVPGGVQDITLDVPQILVGEGAVKLLQKAPKTLKFKSSLGAGKDATITILIGWKAT